MLKGQAPFIFGDGQQTRDLVYVQDVARANLLALTRGNNELYNVGTGKETTIIELLAFIQKIMGKSDSPRFVAARPGDIRRSVFSIDKIKRDLGWEPSISLERGLLSTIESLRGK